MHSLSLINLLMTSLKWILQKDFTKNRVVLEAVLLYHWHLGGKNGKFFMINPFQLPSTLISTQVYEEQYFQADVLKILSHTRKDIAVTSFLWLCELSHYPHWFAGVLLRETKFSRRSKFSLPCAGSMYKAVIFDVGPSDLPPLLWDTCMNSNNRHTGRLGVWWCKVPSLLSRLMKRSLEFLSIIWTAPCMCITYSGVLGWRCSSTGRGPNGAWQKFERGEIGLFSFYEAFSRDLSDTVNGNKWLAPTIFLLGSLIYSL